MHNADPKPGDPGMPANEPPTKKVIGGITLYGPQIAKLAAATTGGLSRSAILRHLIDTHL
jgi:hypothetical protein